MCSVTSTVSVLLFDLPYIRCKEGIRRNEKILAPLTYSSRVAVYDQ